MSLITPSNKKTNILKRKKLKTTKQTKKQNILYLAYYDIQNFSFELTHPIVTFKSLKAAEIYIENRNFEFQILMMASRNSQQSYILDSLKAILNQDFCITVSDLRLASEYFNEEYLKLINDKQSEEEKELLFWQILQKYVCPFRLTVIEYLSKDYD